MNISVTVPDRFVSFLTDWDYRQYLSFGGYGSGKSYSVALKIVLKLMEEKRTALVVRNVFETIRDSCFSLFREILDGMGILSETKSLNRRNIGKVVAVTSPMEIRFPNGSRIIFRGLDNPEKIKSINGVSIVWIEECSEITFQAYTELLGRIRGKGVTKHFFLTCNPVGRWNWVYNTFFVHLNDDGTERVIQDEEEAYKKRTVVRNGVYYMHSVVDDNPFVEDSYVRQLDSLKQLDPELWVVARWGRFGVSGTRVLPNFVVAHNATQFKSKVNSIPARFHFFGLDFGFEESYNALVSCAVDDENKDLYIYDEVYMNHVTDDRFSQRQDVRRVAERAGRCKKAIGADGAEPKSIQFYRQQGFNMYSAKKYVGSRLQNTKKMKRFRHIYCSPKCKNTIRELKDLTYRKDTKGNVIYDEFNIDPHTFSALWYALDKYTVADIKKQKPNTKR